MIYTPVVHFNGTVATQLNVTDKVPWVYIVAVLSSKIIYIGETFDQGGLVTRLSSHFGRQTSSSLRTNAATRASVRKLTPPFLVVGARLPYEEDDASFSGEVKNIRLVIESRLHNIFLEKFALPNGWSIVSNCAHSATTTQSTLNDIDQASSEIFDAFNSAYAMYKDLSCSSPFNLILLDRIQPTVEEQVHDIGSLVTDIEITLYQWVIGELESYYGEDWWIDGVSETIRTHCAMTKEREGKASKDVPPHAYFTMINLKEILKKNWVIFGSSLENISGAQGKDKATSWIDKVNEIRKLWAHPLKSIYFKEKEAMDISFLKNIQSKVREEALS